MVVCGYRQRPLDHVRFWFLDKRQLEGAVFYFTAYSSAEAGQLE